MGYIYKIINKVNGKVYIGQTKKTIEERYARHLSLAKQKKNRYLYDAMNHYGLENFYCVKIEECDNQQLDDKEKAWIKYYQSNNPNYGYNMTEGGGGGDTWTNNPHKKLTIARIKQTKIKNGTWGKAAPKGTPSPTKGKYQISINKDSLLEDIKLGLTNSELCEKYKVSKATLIQRCKVYFHKTPDEIRGIRLTDEEKEQKRLLHLQELSLQRKERWTGEKNPNYKELDYNKLEEYLYQGLTLDQISKKLNLSKPTLISKIKKHYNMTTRELKKYVKSKYEST